MQSSQAENLALRLVTASKVPGYIWTPCCLRASQSQQGGLLYSAVWREADHGLVKQGAVSGPSSSVDLKALPERRNMRELCKDLMRNI